MIQFSLIIPDQIDVVCPLEVLLHRAIVQSNPGVIVTQACERKQKLRFPLNKTLINLLNGLFISLCRKSMFIQAADRKTRAGLESATF